ncbi:putative Fibronectin type III domain-containing protein [Seiridium unicorne]|uniref:Fibronectin type III domain-containing protein n=1 Tax=Seiridium unicorne TaxID=138068 RepID=A0ABR2V5D0_9PEZI
MVRIISGCHSLLNVVASCLLFTFFIAATTSTPVPPPVPTKVMIVGDSITQGRQGDFTWRYRLWQWKNENKLNLEFVGPRSGTNPPRAATPPLPPIIPGEPFPDLVIRDGGGYSKQMEDSEEFVRSNGSRHCAVWGWQVRLAKEIIQQHVVEYEPDYLLVELGFNDIGFSITNAEQTLENVKVLIDHARAGNRRLHFALANVPQHSYLADSAPNGLLAKLEQYNNLLEGKVKEWSTDESQIHLVNLRSLYDCDEHACRDVYDGLHPNFLGEYEIASAFVQTLTDDFGLQGKPLVIPSNSTFPHVSSPGNVRAASRREGVVVTWDPVYDAFGYEYRMRAADEKDWTLGKADANRLDAVWLANRTSYEFQVRTTYGDQSQPKSQWSSAISTIARPETVLLPTNINITRNGDQYNVSWSPPLGEFHVYAYELIIRRRNGVFDRQGVTGSTHTLRGLQFQGGDSAAVLAWTDLGAGKPVAVWGDHAWDYKLECEYRTATRPL